MKRSFTPPNWTPHTSRHGIFDPDYEGRRTCRVCGGAYDAIRENWSPWDWCEGCDQEIARLESLPPWAIVALLCAARKANQVRKTLVARGRPRPDRRAKTR